MMPIIKITYKKSKESYVCDTESADVGSANSERNAARRKKNSRSARRARKVSLAITKEASAT